jgi:hypothetical protein
MNKSDYQAIIELCKNIDLLGLIEPTTTLRKVGAREYAGPCPKCGGKDRFHVNLDKGWFCRQCHSEHFGDQIDFRVWLNNVTWIEAVQQLVGRRPVSKETMDRLKQEREERERKRIEEDRIKQESARTKLQESKLWQVYHSNLDAMEKRDLWRARGIPDDWQNYYKVGYCPSREWMRDEEIITSDSLTIPYLQYAEPMEYQCVTLKHRLLNTDKGGDKYRPELSGLGNQLFTPWYENPIGKEVLILEGEIKSMVVFSRLWVGRDNMNVLPWLDIVGIAGMNAKPGLLSALDNSEKIYICLDPDAKKQAVDLSTTLGKDRCKVISLPDKIDDLFIMGSLTTKLFLDILKEQ